MRRVDVNMNFTIKSRIIESIKKDKLIFFIGSGFSKDLIFPDWKQLVIHILNELKTDYQSLGTLIAPMESDVLTVTEVLEKIKNYRGNVFDIIEKKFKINEKEKELIRNSSKYKKIWEITKKVVTTNYDKALETSNPHAEVILYHHDNMIKKIQEIKEFIFKIHGSIEDTAKCILFLEDYKKLYEDEKSAIFELKKFISDSTIIFIGFSLKDPFVQNVFQNIRNLYNGINHQNYIITIEDEDFSAYGVEAINIEKWCNLDLYLDELLKIKEKHSNGLEVAIASQFITKTEPLTKIAILIASPIDKDYKNSFHEYLKCFKNIQAEIDCKFLSIETLFDLYEYEYIFIFTQEHNGYIYIEDHNLAARLISIKELENSIGDNNAKMFVLFIKEDFDIDLNNLTKPFVVSKYSKEILQNLLYKIFRKADIDHIKENFRYVNINNTKFSIMQNGNCKINRFNSRLSNQIDSKQFLNFVGRKYDLVKIIERILELKNYGQILSIKGSGGIGKTATIKYASYLLAERNYFKDGIYFIDCEHIDSYESFENKIAQCFNVENIIGLKEYIEQNQLEKDSLIIIDNYETMLYIKECEKAKKIVRFISDYITIVITSREPAFENENFEIVYEMQNFTTDEALMLFNQNYPNIAKEDIKILRSEILENLLNNNPLAINIVTRNLPKYKNIKTLKDDLENDFFTTTNEYLVDIFDNQYDINIEKSRSLYQSINYSYKKLAPNEKLAFELLSLFSNGINIEDFKEVFSSKKDKVDRYYITDKEIKSLENKSLVESFNGSMKLQSIVGRFAEHNFSKRTLEAKKVYYQKAFQYNLSLLQHIIVLSKQGKSDGFNLFNSNRENVFKSVSYIDLFDYNKLDKIRYLINISMTAIHTHGEMEYYNNLIKKSYYFENDESEKVIFNLILVQLRYFNGSFLSAYKKLNEVLDFESMKNLDTNILINQLIIPIAVNTYFMEGKAFECIEYLIEKNVKIDYLPIPEIIFELGEYKCLHKVLKNTSFFSFEIDYAVNKLDIKKLENYLSNLYKMDYIEIMQIFYFKVKNDIGNVNSREVKKLVITNPYTRGLKHLMLAMLEEDYHKAYDMYKEALIHLQHVKYYYVEGTYYFVKYLKFNNHYTYLEEFEKGYSLAKEYNYRYLRYLFDTLEKNGNDKYDESLYELPCKLDIETYIAELYKTR